MNASARDPFAGMAEHALEYARRGLPVFPCDPATKQPLVGRERGPDGKPIPKSGGLAKATTDEAVIREWWRRYPQAMIGVRMGPDAGVFAIDPDMPKVEGDPNGLAAWGHLPQNTGFAVTLTPTRRREAAGTCCSPTRPTSRSRTAPAGSRPVSMFEEPAAM